jgi:2-polyprenyl-3-methyl-5-hydroxy-6-metoxy-1,4-benzoquinol methylase
MAHEHKFILSEIPYYEKCVLCGSYHSIAQEPPKTIYEDVDYWSYDQKRSKPEEQVLNLQCIDDCGISKVDRMMQFVPKGQRALEIGCFPGVLMQKLTDAGYSHVVGIEPSLKYIPFICEQAKEAIVINGYFPEITKEAPEETFDVIVGMDVFEHVDDYEAFIKEAHRLLAKGGTMVLMSPIILEDGLYRKRDFAHPDEHCWIHSESFLREYLSEIFSEVKFTRWVCGHELVIVKK